MNATVRAVAQGSVFSRPVAISLSLSKFWLCILFLAIFSSALGIVYLKDLNRRLFINYQNIEQSDSKLNVGYGKLLLEEGAWSTEDRVLAIAQNKLNMEVPKAKDVVLVKL